MIHLHLNKIINFYFFKNQTKTLKLTIHTHTKNSLFIPEYRFHDDVIHKNLRIKEIKIDPISKSLFKTKLYLRKGKNQIFKFSVIQFNQFYIVHTE